jgi:proline iminopeptidase
MHLEEMNSLSWADPELAGYVEVEGGRIWYRVNGTANRHKTPLLCLHGGPGISHHYIVPMVDLADERPVVLFDQLDSGNSDRPNDPANWNVSRFVAEIPQVRKALDLERVIVFGHSWGGALAVEYALSNPQGLVALVLGSPLISVKRWIADAQELVAALPDEDRATIQKHEAAGTTDDPEYDKALRTFSYRHLCRSDPRPDYVMKAFSLFNDACYNVMWGPSEFTVTGVLKDFERATELPSIGQETLFICGSEDEARPDAMREFAAAMPNAEVRIVSDAAHFTAADQREAYISAIRAFMSQFD